MGRQFANDSMTPEPISTHDDSYGNCLANDRPMHTDTTPGLGSFNWSGKQYSDDFDGGFKKYGVAVGSAPKATGQTISGDKADRGKES